MRTKRARQLTTNVGATVTSFFHLHSPIPSNLWRINACIELRSTIPARDFLILANIHRGVEPFDSTDENYTGSTMDRERFSVILYSCALDNDVKPELD